MLLPVLFGCTVLLTLLSTHWYKKLQHQADLLKQEHQQIIHLKQQLTQANLEAQAAQNAKKQFLANISHEIRTPISGIMGLLELMQDSTLPREAKQLHQELTQSAKGLLCIINDLIDHNDLEAGTLSLSPEKTALGPLFNQTLQTQAIYAQQKQLSVHYWLDPKLSPSLLVDGKRIQQVITNLLSNAIKFTQQGSIRLEVQVSQDHPNNQTLDIKVTDTGIGISAAQQAQLFTAFSPLDQASDRPIYGAGLGLAISQALIAKMGGKLSLRSEANKGSQFSFNLLVEKVALTDEELSSCEQEEKLQLTALLINETDQTPYLERYLAALGYQVQSATAASRQELNTIIAQYQTPTLKQPPHCFITLPQWQVWQQCHQYNEQHDFNANIIVLTPKPLLSPEPIADNWCLSTNPLMPEHLTHALTEPVSHDAIIDNLMEGGIVQSYQSRYEAEQAGRLILVAEDHPINQKVIKQQLAKMNLHADIVDNGVEALAALKVHNYGLLLTDCHMPEMDGYALTQAIRQQEKQQHSSSTPLPIIALTANAVRGEEQRCLALGMSDFMVKPVSQRQLEQLIEQWLPASNLTQSSTEVESSQDDDVLVGEVLVNEEQADEALANEFAALLGEIEQGIDQSSNHDDFTNLETGDWLTAFENESKDEQGLEVAAINAQPLICLDSLTTLFGDRATASQLVTEFTDNHQQDMALLAQSFSSGDYQAIRIIAHRMKGAASTMQCEPLAKQLEEVEKNAAEILTATSEKQYFYYADLLTDGLDQLEVMTETLLAKASLAESDIAIGR